MWAANKDKTNITPIGFPFSTPQPKKKWSYSDTSSPPFATQPRPLPASEKKWRPPQRCCNNTDRFHVIHKVPAGDSPYVRAKHVQLVDKNPNKAVSMFWAAINSGDRVDSALKDMAVVMKQLNRSDEAIEAIKSFRHLCPLESQESLDNILLELYKRSGHIDEQVELLQSKLRHIEDATTLNANRTKLARSQGKKIQITMGQEYSRLLGNLAWAYLQQDKYTLAEEFYRKALSLEPDKNKQCNLAVCLMYTNRMREAKFLLSTVKDSNRSRPMDESYAKSYERAIEVMDELESEKGHVGNQTPFSSFLSRHKETESVEEGKRGNWSNTEAELACRKRQVSLLPPDGLPRVPFTQPRMGERGDWRRDWGRASSGDGCLRKLHFGLPAEGKTDVSGNHDLEAKLPATCSEMSAVASNHTEVISQVNSDGNEKVTLKAVRCKKSWADLVEEEEHERLLLEASRNCLNSEEEFGNENVDSNIITEKFESWSINNDGYRTQPGTATSHMSRAVKCLTFDLGEKPNGDCSSPLQKRNLDFESGDCSNEASSARKVRLQVFQDITLSSGRRGN